MDSLLTDERLLEAWNSLKLDVFWRLSVSNSIHLKSDEILLRLGKFWTTKTKNFRSMNEARNFLKRFSFISILLPVLEILSCEEKSNFCSCYLFSRNGFSKKRNIISGEECKSESIHDFIALKFLHLDDQIRHRDETRSSFNFCAFL